ncbi:hypothetical protein C8Q78DRAFT_991103 [Trametes maxima]|nr:hypothetical protein C8Q78DRAFT_991103 [Trametes maxima]
MRRSILGPHGGAIRGPLRVPMSPFAAFPLNQAAFYDTMRSIGRFKPRQCGGATAFFALPPQAVVSTHGDLHKHNIMVDVDGHVSAPGVFDWGSAAKYWERGMAPGNSWERYMAKSVAAGASWAIEGGVQRTFWSRESVSGNLKRRRWYSAKCV